MATNHIFENQITHFWPITKKWEFNCTHSIPLVQDKVKEKFRHFLHGFVPTTKNSCSSFYDSIYRLDLLQGDDNSAHIFLTENKILRYLHWCLSGTKVSFRQTFPYLFWGNIKVLLPANYSSGNWDFAWPTQKNMH